jgi:hypothetical protein
MKQQRMILGLATVALVGAGVWAWHGNSATPEATAAQSMATSPFRAVNVPVPRTSAPESTPAVTPAPQAKVAPTAADDSTQAAAAPVNAEPPSVDTPEPSQHKFAHGSRAEPEQI